MKVSPLSLLAALSAVVTASPVAIERSTTTTVTSAVLSDLEYFAQWAGAAYCNSQNSVGQAISCADGVCPTLGGESTKTIATFDGDLTDLQGFVATDSTRELIVVSAKGSTSLENWIDDFLFEMTSCTLVSGCEVHQGFYAAYNEVSSAIFAAVKAATAANPSYKLVVTGHSLGAAVATLIGAYLRQGGYSLDIYTYGSPRVGNDAWANFVTAQPGAEYRVTHLDDPVPRLPPLLLGYYHTSPEFWLSDGTATTTDYGVSDIKVCVGTANTNCNGGTGGFDTTAHNYYLEAIDACSGGFTFKRDEDVAVADLEARMDMFSRLDGMAARQLASSS